MIEPADLARTDRGFELDHVAERNHLTAGRDQRRFGKLFGRFAPVSAQDDRQPRLAVEIFAEPCAVAERAHDRAERVAIPAGFGHAPIVRDRVQLERRLVRIRIRLHVGAREFRFEQLAAFLGNAVQRVGIVALQMDRDRARRSADTAEQLAFGRECARVGEIDRDLVAHQFLEIADAFFIDDARADRAAARPEPDVIVLERRLLVALHVRRKTLDQLVADFDC